MPGAWRVPRHDPEAIGQRSDLATPTPWIAEESMKENKRRALPDLTVRDRVALDLRELQLCVRHPMGPVLSVRANARLTIGPDPESDWCHVTMSECDRVCAEASSSNRRPTLSSPGPCSKITRGSHVAHRSDAHL